MAVGVVVAALVVGAVVFLGVEKVGVVVSLAKGMARFPVALVAGEAAATIEGDKVICSQFLGVGASRKKRHQLICKGLISITRSFLF